MNKITITLLSLVVLLAATGGALYYVFPQILVDMTNRQYASTAKLEKKMINIEGEDIYYYVSQKANKAETVVLVHGMGDDKSSFLRSAALLSQHYNVILPDLLGHGASQRNPQRDYSIGAQSDFLKAFINALSIVRPHWVGNSMGGHTVAAFAIKYPDSVDTLTLLNAAGLKLDDHVVYTGFGKTIDSDKELQAVFDRVFYKSPALPMPIRNLMREKINASKDFVDNTLVPSITQGAYFNLKDLVQKIQAPTLVLWGRHDRVVNINVAEYFAANIPVSKLQFIEHAGHSPQLEVPEEVALAIINFISSEKSDMIKSTKAKHAALTQLYRWYQLYEGELSDVRITNQLGILSDDVLIKSAAGEMRGAVNYPSRLAVYKGWQNAHHVQNVEVNERAGGTLNVEADIIYQNIKPTGEKSNYTLHYSTMLAFSPNQLLPRFTELNLMPTGELESTAFDNAYAKNKMLSLMHYWLLNMEQLDGNVEPFKELLAPEFELNFSTADVISTTEMLAQWLQTVPKQLMLSAHTPQNFTVKPTGANTYKVEVDFIWRGVTTDNQVLKATTHHNWLVVDDPNERFARIKKMSVTQTQALSPLE